MNKRIPYRIEQTRNKHSRAVYKDDTIVIRLAKNLSKTEKKLHAEDLLQRMAKQVAKDIQRERVDPFRPVLQGEDTTITLSSGREYVITTQEGAKLGIQTLGNKWTLTRPATMSESTVHRLLWKKLSEVETEYMTALMNLINESTLNVPVHKVRLKYAQTQWGSCSTAGAIMLNAALLFVPEKIQEYVIVHELAHRLHHDHSPRFWGAVERHLPSYKSHRKELKGFRLIKL